MTSENLPDIAPVTARDVRALRHAHELLFTLHDCAARIVAVRDGHDSPTGFEQSHDIAAAATVIDYDHFRTVRDPSDPLAGYSAYHHAYGQQFSEVIAAVVGRIAAGDRLSLSWRRGNNGEALTAAGMVRDELRLAIHKPGGRCETYPIAVAVGRDNSARMIGYTAPPHVPDTTTTPTVTP